MSVINKMLRDLDARRAEGALPDLPRQVRSAALQGTASVGWTRQGPARRWLRWLLLLLGLLLVVAAAAAWYWQGDADAPVVPAGMPQQHAAVAPAPRADASAPTAAAPVPQLPASASVHGGGGSGGSVAPGAAASAPGQAARPAPAATTAVTRVAPTAAVAQRAVAPVAAAAASSPVAAVAARSAASAPVIPPSPAPPRPSPLQETLAQAQSLWAAGSHIAATDLMRDAVAAGERTGAGNSELLPLVRELARMELAQGRSEAVLDLLARLESRWSDQADLWAVRGNATQRLGRHAESVQAYQRALQLRPGEQRWLLGAAVSLAALGQVDAAAAQAEQARALGPVSPEVLSYLRQAGVPLR